MAVTPDMNQIAVVMSQLQHNYTQLAQNWFNIFYNNQPQDVMITFFDELGNFEQYVVPNRAKDFRNIHNGEGSPEGVVVAGVGNIYQDLTNGEVYLKKTAEGSIGWVRIVSETDIANMIRKGVVNPNGNVTGNKGDLYVDTGTGNLFLKTTDNGNTGWIQAISSEYATHTEVAEAVEAATVVKANIGLDNLTSEGEKHFLNKTQVSNCILEAPNGIYNVLGPELVVQAELKFMIPQGRNAEDDTLKSQEYVIPSALTYTNTQTTAESGMVLMLIIDKITGTHSFKVINSANLHYSDTEPQAPEADLEMLWFSFKDNLWRYSNNGSQWEEQNGILIASFDIILGGSLSNDVSQPVLNLVKTSDLDYVFTTLKTYIDSVVPVIEYWS